MAPAMWQTDSRYERTLRTLQLNKRRVNHLYYSLASKLKSLKERSLRWPALLVNWQLHQAKRLLRTLRNEVQAMLARSRIPARVLRPISLNTPHLITDLTGFDDGRPGRENQVPQQE